MAIGTGITGRAAQAFAERVIMDQQRGLLGIGSLAAQGQAMGGLAQAQQSNPFAGLSYGTGDNSLGFKTKSKNLREELQAETDEWLKGI